MRRVILGSICWALLPLAARAGEQGRAVTADAIQPQAAVDGEGNIYVVFLQRGNVAVSVSTDRGKTFSAPAVAIDAGGKAHGGHQRGPHIGVDAKKNLVVTCPLTFDAQEATKKYPVADLYLATSADGGKTWAKPLQVNEASRKAPEALHWLAVAPDGGAHIAWLDMRDRSGGQDLFYAIARAGKLGPNRKIAEQVRECCAPGLAVDGKGNPIVTYREGGAKNSREIFFIRSADGGATFGKAARLNSADSREPSCPMSAPAVAVSADGGRFFAAWMDKRNGPKDRDVFWLTGDGPAPPRDERVHSAGQGTQDHPALTIDDKGTVWAVWEDGRDGKPAIWAKTAPGSPERRVSLDGLDAAAYPSVASGGGVVALVYEGIRDKQKQVVFRLLSP